MANTRYLAASALAIVAAMALTSCLVVETDDGPPPTSGADSAPAAETAGEPRKPQTHAEADAAGTRYGGMGYSVDERLYLTLLADHVGLRAGDEAYALQLAYDTCAQLEYVSMDQMLTDYHRQTEFDQAFSQVMIGAATWAFCPQWENDYEQWFQDNT